jgi:hypothetical protein
VVLRAPKLRSYVLLALLASTGVSASKSNFPKHYKGTPYQDARYQGGPQKIPGRVECAYYDRGGEASPTTTPTPRTTAVEPSIPPTERT